jgi:hypothetical protein
MKNLLTILKFGTVAAVFAFASYETTRWGGSCGYVQIEHELTFVDSIGNRNNGVELRVEDQRGNEFFCFPVTDYLPGQKPKSDKDGVIRFHHVHTAVEWDNYGWSLFWCIPVQTTKSPVYVCRFLRDGKEVHRVRYNDLPDWDWPSKGWEQVPKIKRSWNWSAMIPNEIKYKEQDTEESYYSRLRFFFNDRGKGLPTREVRVASRNAMKLPFELERAGADKQEAVEEIEFPVIRRTITIDP